MGSSRDYANEHINSALCSQIILMDFVLTLKQTLLPYQHSPLDVSNRSILCSLWVTNLTLKCRLILVVMPWLWLLLACLSLTRFDPQLLGENFTAREVARKQMFVCVILFSAVSMMLQGTALIFINMLLVPEGQMEVAGSLWKDRTLSENVENWK